MRSYRTKLLYCLAAAVAAGLGCKAGAQNVPAGQAPEAGVSHALAQARTARLSELRYTLRYTLALHGATTTATERIQFRDSGAGDLALDFRDGTLQAAELNGKVLGTELVNGHLVLPATALRVGENVLDTKFTANVAAAGKAITRYTDKDDGSEYVYTLFVPMDASMALPCFDQPDLKGRFTLAVVHPAEWTVVGNTAGTAVSPNEMAFAETRPISTYLFAFAAGPFARIAPGAAGEPAMLVRKSQLARARAEAPEAQAMTASGVRWLSEYFAQPFPFPKYDLVLIPGFPFGGMEHAGATFLNEDGVLFRSTPTQSDYFRRDILVLHETTHQWFGDLVTMRWFDDLWLKEGFAQYMAYKAMAALKPQTQPWKHFAEDIKPLAYGIDETQGTTPIFQNIPNLKDAKSAYGAIVYQKAPAILKQLDFRLNIGSGVDADIFQSGLRLYLSQHVYANATWPDLIHSFEQAAAEAHAHRPATSVQQWADAWITRRGMPQVDTAFTCAAGKLTSLTLTQHDILPDGYTWPITSRIDLTYSRDRHVHATLVADWSDRTFRAKELIGKQCPLWVFSNDDDEAYGRFLLDANSKSYVTGLIRQEKVTPGVGYLGGSMLWSALWEDVRIARTSPKRFVELALLTLPNDPDEALARAQGRRLADSLQDYLGPQSKAKALTAVESVVGERMLHAASLDVRIANFRTFTSIAESPAALTQMRQLLAGTLVVPGLRLRPLDRWNLVGHLVVMNDPEAKTLFAAERAKDHTGEAQKYAYAAEAGTPDTAVKAQYFEEYLTSKTVQEDWITQSLRPFNSWNQQALTLPYLERALNALPEIKRNRKIFFLGAWLGSFLDGQSTPEAQRVVHAWLAQKDIDPDLRLKVLEQSDALDRTVLIRKAYPD